jgi:raffinose/stachyose/melibiose transport system permease protein
MIKFGPVGKVIAYICLIALALINLFPIVVLFISSLKTTKEIFLTPLALPKVWSLKNYAQAWEKSNFITYFRNSVIVSVLSIGCIVMVTSMAAYVIARFKFPGRRALFLYLIAGIALPVRLAIIPIFLLVRDLHIQDTYLSLILVYTAGGVAFSMFLLVNFFKSLPRELEESAKIDGAGAFRIYWSVDLPLLKPALATVTIFNFIDVWNDFFFPLILINKKELRTIPLGIQIFYGEYNIQWNLLFAALNIAVIPILIVFIIMSRQFISGLTEGAVK